MSFYHSQLDIKAFDINQDKYSKRVNQRVYIGIGKRPLDMVAPLVSRITIVPIIIAVALIKVIIGCIRFFAPVGVAQAGASFNCLKSWTMCKVFSHNLPLMLGTEGLVAREWNEAQKLTFQTIDVVLKRTET